MLESLITSKTRIKLLLKFFINPETRAYLRSLAAEFGESTNSVRLELNRLEKAGLLKSENEGRTKVYRSNTKNPLFPDIHNLVKKYIGIDLIENIINKLGKVELAFISGDYAQGIDNGIIDLVIIGKINKVYLNELTDITEKAIKRKIRPLVLSNSEYSRLKKNLNMSKALVLWNNHLKTK